MLSLGWEIIPAQQLINKIATEHDNFIYINIITMNITSATPNNVSTVVETLHKLYVESKEEPIEGKRDNKFKSKIRIKSKSQGKFILQSARQSSVSNICKTINLISLVKQAKSSQMMAKLSQDKRVSMIPQQCKPISSQRELIFLKQLVNKRREMPLILTNRQQINRSRSQSQLNENQPRNQKLQNILPSKSESKLSNAFPSTNQTNGLQWDKKANQYQYYDNVVKDLLSEMSTRKQAKFGRPLISPSKYCQAKQKLLSKIQTDQLSSSIPVPDSFCNFKALIKIQPKKQSMVFRMNDYVADTVYERKITSYIKFLYKVNFSNAIYTDLSLSSLGKIYKVKVGSGNNCELIKMLIKRRFWLQLDNNVPASQISPQNKISFIWTQNTIEGVHSMQKMNESKPSISQNQKFSKKLKKIRKIQKRRQSFENNQKILNSAEIQQSQSHYLASNFGAYSIHPKIEPEIISNHLPSNYIIGSKKILFLLLHWYYENVMKIDPFTYLPKTYNIKSGDIGNPMFQKFLKMQGEKLDQVWIVKPGQNTNRGNGITVTSFSQVSRLIKRKQVHKNGDEKTYIIQKYLKPFLYHGRKFDIRHYLLITSVKGNLKAYWYKEGYIRTSSEKYDIDDLGNQFIHLTNDAIQKKSQLYGKYEPGNKLSYTQFQRYLDQTYPQKKYSFQTQILKKMKQITTDLMHASFTFLDPQRKNHNFELFGMDFMIDYKFQPYLIEVNANPCLQISCPVLQRIIPTLIEHSFRVGLDPLFPPPQHYPINCRYQLSDRILQKLKYQLIFDQKSQGSQLRQKISCIQNKFVLSNKNLIEPDEQIFDNDGQNSQVFQID